MVSGAIFLHPRARLTIAIASNIAYSAVTAIEGVETPTDTHLSDASAQTAKVAGYWVRNILRTHPDQETVPLRDPDGDEDLTVPRQAAELLQRILAAIAAGTPVTVVPDHAELTTQQAAEYLNVSRPFLIKLLKRGDIEYRLVGTHRRVRADSLRVYRDQSRAEQRAAADALSRLAADSDLY